ncbi:hypothetical protein Bca4012_011169 [Brassica carinata]
MNGITGKLTKRKKKRMQDGPIIIGLKFVSKRTLNVAVCEVKRPNGRQTAIYRDLKSGKRALYAIAIEVCAVALSPFPSCFLRFNLYNKRELRNMAKTWVFWDINSCPVPKDCDARLVRSSIESALKKAGYCEGDLTITAIGNLNHILQLNPDFHQSIFSTGIRICQTPPG